MWSTSASTSRHVAEARVTVDGASAARPQPIVGEGAIYPLPAAAPPPALIRAAITAALALYLESGGGPSPATNAWGSATHPDDRDAGRPWTTGSDVWRRAERPR